SNCLSVLPHDTEFGEKRRIHDLSCNRDYTCLVGDCPSFVTITPLRHKRRRVARRADRAPRSALPSGDLPDPEPIASLDGQYGIYFRGIGGTGVVTANRILATAAEHAGLVVSGLDQTGLSQKAGSVVSPLPLARDPRSPARARRRPPCSRAIPRAPTSRSCSTPSRSGSARTAPRSSTRG